MPLPRMRTACAAMNEIKTMDPNTSITECAIRRTMKRGCVHVVPNGRKHLVNLDELLNYFAQTGAVANEIELDENPNLIRIQTPQQSCLGRTKCMTTK